MKAQKDTATGKWKTQYRYTTWDGKVKKSTKRGFDTKRKAEEWLWKPYIPYGKITIVQGDPGEGKTTFVLKLASELSRGRCSDESEKNREPINIIYQTAEDGLADTVKPRLEDAGADCTRVMVIDDSEESLSMQDIRFERAIEQTGAKLYFRPYTSLFGR